MPTDHTYFFSELKPETYIYLFLDRRNSIIEQQHDKTNNMVSLPSKDSDQVGHSDFLVLSLWVQETP